VSSSDEPQPKWHILRLTNYVATFGFLLSVLKFASNASTYLDDSTSLLQFLVIWSICMCYFFGSALLSWMTWKVSPGITSIRIFVSPCQRMKGECL
jgi:hypothetical protein